VPNLLVDARVVEQVEVVQSAESVHVVGREGEAVVVAGVAAGAAWWDEQVAEEIGGPSRGVGDQRGQDDEVSGPRRRRPAGPAPDVGEHTTEVLTGA
jgi:hypothetical protein